LTEFFKQFCNEAPARSRLCHHFQDACRILRWAARNLPPLAGNFRTPAAIYEALPAIAILPAKFCREITEACRKITTPCRKITEACRELHNPCREITRACREFHCLRPDLQEAADKPFTAIDAKERTERKKPSPVLSDTLSHRMGEGRGEGLNFQPATFN
jgi:hypothetical protein